MRDRARLVGGDVEIIGRPGEGTVVTARLPRGRPHPDV
jgi:signal transduction histidine kinase